MFEKINNNKELTKQDIVSLLKITSKSELEELYKIAKSKSKGSSGYEFKKVATLKFSNNCSTNCLYCSLRKSNEKLKRYRLTSEQITKVLDSLKNSEFDCLLLEIGQDDHYNIEEIKNLINYSCKHLKNKTFAISIGERSEKEYQMLKDAGVNFCFLRHKTSDPILYRNLHPDMKYSNRIKLLWTLKRLGFSVGSGVMIGLPGQTFESLANDILMFKTLDIDFIDIIQYNPHPDTPLAKKFYSAGGYFAPAIGYFDIKEMICKMTAITRIVNKKADILVNTDMANRIQDERHFNCGANISILNLTKVQLRKMFDTPNNKNK